MEYVDAVPLGEGYAAQLTPEQQLELVQSVRLAVRVWRKPISLSRVFTMFFSTVRPAPLLSRSDWHRDDDLGGCDTEIVWEQWRERQIWDTISATANVNQKIRSVKQPEDPYDFVLAARG
ncbi:hypothetical protein GLOTRDRAFT_131722 [Gloeophyllum trabeum ATCC 11539]|uniref:Uncharacterized protein n=1 Tax=Gloeophyllum trabeum (strain ATCC 11539 / FP-39264 / Madison 617) TaxID=670483 RepID=S7RE71_GLOTA|nr:uncharacterized protein GLOTRDRAFT_131722 [Gloeophyllum trabeum ATCC 11539]EPQ52480.1 hypothetical protein GLOTRDRAFT_131722 [Gloeophyllum trabeum ATCC 11539]